MFSFNGTSTVVGYLMLNLLLYIRTVLFQTIQFCISIVFVYIQLNVKKFYFKQFSVALVHSLVLFDP